jgi:transposase
VARVTTAGQRHDSLSFDAVMCDLVVVRPSGPPRRRPDRVLADKAYSSRRIRDQLRRRGIRATIPEPADQQAARARRGSNGGRPPAFDVARYKDRNVVERAINKLRATRAVATRFDKREYIYRGTIDVATIRIWLRDPVQRDPRDTP